MADILEFKQQWDAHQALEYVLETIPKDGKLVLLFINEEDEVAFSAHGCRKNEVNWMLDCAKFDLLG